MAATVQNPRPIGPLNQALATLDHEGAVNKLRDICLQERGDPDHMVLNTFRWRHPATREYRFIQLAMRGLSALEHERALRRMASVGGTDSVEGAQELEKNYLRFSLIAYRTSQDPHAQEVEENGKTVLEPVWSNGAGCWQAYSDEVLEKLFSPGIAQAAAAEAAALSGIGDTGSEVELAGRAFG